eukprot:6490238-Prymnesium_polylepis.1
MDGLCALHAGGGRRVGLRAVPGCRMSPPVHEATANFLMSFCPHVWANTWRRPGMKDQQSRTIK